MRDAGRGGRTHDGPAEQGTAPGAEPREGADGRRGGVHGARFPRRQDRLDRRARRSHAGRGVLQLPRQAGPVLLRARRPRRPRARAAAGGAGAYRPRGAGRVRPRVAGPAPPGGRGTARAGPDRHGPDADDHRRRTCPTAVRTAHEGRRDPARTGPGTAAPVRRTAGAAGGERAHDPARREPAGRRRARLRRPLHHRQRL